MNRITFNQLKLVEAALAGIESGDYGQCQQCLRVWQVDDQMAWSSPIWITR